MSTEVTLPNGNIQNLHIRHLKISDTGITMLCDHGGSVHIRNSSGANGTSSPADPMAESLRGSGRTTAGMLRAIAHALENPLQWVPFRDHYGTPFVGLGDRAKHLYSMCAALGLNMQVEHGHSDLGELRIRSMWQKSAIGKGSE